MRTSSMIGVMAVIAVAVTGFEAWLRMDDTAALRAQVTAATARADAATAAATQAGTTAGQALAAAQQATAAANQAQVLASEARQAAADATAAAQAAAARAAAPPAPAPAAASDWNGQALALQICSACHVVGAMQPFAPTLQPPAPDFRAIAARPSTSAESILAFLAHPHGKMVDPMLIDDQRKALAGYIMSLRAPG
jgi:mono/diheme cytochrome c family protein